MNKEEIASLIKYRYVGKVLSKHSGVISLAEKTLNDAVNFVEAIKKYLAEQVKL